MQEHLNTLAEDLQGAGFGGLFVIGNSIGGLSRVEDGVNSPIYLVGSGPALAPVAAGEHWRHEAGRETDADHRDLIVVDTGGTSFDVSLITAGEIRRSRDTWLGAQFTGHLTGLSSVEVLSVGAGGGSIAWIDDGGLLRVGPRSAGSVPGPACYGRGGSEPTVTDAALALGYIDAANFAGGRLNLSVGAAREVISETIASGLDNSIEEAAAAILDVTSVDMVSAIKELTVKQGLDPRNSLLVAGGGAAGLNIVPIAVELGCTEILVPHNAGVLSAMGGHFADMVTEVATSHFTTSSDFEHDVVAGLLKDLELRLDGVIKESSGLRPAGVEKLFSVECRYLHQSWELEISIDGIDLQSDLGVVELVDRFHKHHQTVYSVNEPGQHVEFLRWNGRLEMRLPETRPLDELPTGEQTEAMPAKRGTAYFSDLGFSYDTPYYEAETLCAGQVIEGPAIIEEPSTTLVVYPSSRLRVTKYGNYLVVVDSDNQAPQGVIG
jgi:N-methylhydantoinase A